MSCLNPGDEIIVPEPAYANYMAFAVSAGAVIRPITSTIENGFALPSIEQFEALINERTRGILICNPNNPTGYLYTRKEMNRIRDLVKKHDLFLFSDEVYREFIYTGSPYISACHLEGIEENVVLIDSVSKRYSECGIRIGALITKNKTLRAAVMKFCQARLSPPLLGQIAAEASIDAPREYAIHTYEEYIERRNCLVDELNKIDGVYSPIPMGAFYTIARLPIDDSDKFCEWCLREFEYEGATIMLAPASGFYSEPGLGKDEVRIAYILEKEELKKAIRILGEARKAYNQMRSWELRVESWELKIYFMKSGALRDKTKHFAVRIIRFVSYLRDEKHEFVMSKQILRSATSIGANVRESWNAQSRSDFQHKLSIALKEADETAYWLELLVESEIIDRKQFDPLYSDLDEIIAMLTASVKTMKETNLSTLNSQLSTQK